MFSKDDLKRYEQFERMLAERIRFSEMGMSELALSYQSLAWFAGLKKKIEDHLFEIEKIQQINKPEKEAE